MRRVVPPFRLTVPFVEGEGAAEKAFDRAYVLQSVVVHLGGSLHGGHYVTYAPYLSEVNEDGVPTRWSRASDASPKQPCSWEQASEEIVQNCYMLIYDLEKSPAAS